MDSPILNRSTTAINLAPLDRRADTRQVFYRNEAASVEIITRKGAAMGKIIDADLRGVGVVITDPANWSFFEESGPVEISVTTFSLERSWSLSGIIRDVGKLQTERETFLRVGIELTGSEKSEIQRAKMIGFHFYECPKYFKPLAYFDHPINFSEKVHLQVLSVSPNGFRAQTSARNKGLFPGLSVQVQFVVPTRGEFTVEAHILQVSPSDTEDVAYIDLCFVSPPPELLAALAEFVMTFNPNTTLAILQKQGFFVDSVFNAIRIRFLSTQTDWERVLQLRMHAYHSVGKLTSKSQPHDFADPTDRFSRHLVALIGGKIVGAARVVFVGQELNRSEHHSMEIPIPKKIAERGFVEFSRFCTDPEFRGADVFVALIRQATIVAVASKIPYIIANCNSDLYEMYRKLGFRKVGPQFEAFGRKDCSLIVNKTMSTMIFGKNSSLATWNYVIFPVGDYFRNRFQKLYFLNPWYLVNRLIHPLVLRSRLRKKYKTFSKKKRTRGNA